MTYYVDSVVCDYGVYETHLEKGKQVKNLLVICELRQNALLIADILNTDLSNKVYHISEERINKLIKEGTND